MVPPLLWMFSTVSGVKVIGSTTNSELAPSSFGKKEKIFTNVTTFETSSTFEYHANKLNAIAPKKMHLPLK